MRAVPWITFGFVAMALIFADIDARMLLTSSAATAIMAAYGAFAGNRAAIVTGAALAIVGNPLEHAERTGSITSRGVRSARALGQRSTVTPGAVVEPRL